MVAIDWPDGKFGLVLMAVANCEASVFRVLRSAGTVVSRVVRAPPRVPEVSWLVMSVLLLSRTLPEVSTCRLRACSPMTSGTPLPVVRVGWPLVWITERPVRPASWLVSW